MCLHRWIFQTLLIAGTLTLSFAVPATAQDPAPAAPAAAKASKESIDSLDRKIKEAESLISQYKSALDEATVAAAQKQIAAAKEARDSGEQQLVAKANTTMDSVLPTLQPSAIAKFLKWMNDGGIFMWLILAVFLFGIVLIVERTATLFGKLSVNAETLFAEIRDKLSKGDIKGAIAACDAKPNAALSQVLKAALLKAGQPERVIQDAVDEADLTVLPAIQARTGYLSMIANVATLMGLLGTILGLIAAFAGLAHADPSQKQAVLAQGIAIAMNTTAFGLICAIPCMISHSLLMGRTTSIIQQIDEYAVKTINMLVAMQKRA